jgi:hypothetical protein
VFLDKKSIIPTCHPLSLKGVEGSPSNALIDCEKIRRIRFVFFSMSIVQCAPCCSSLYAGKLKSLIPLHWARAAAWIERLSVVFVQSRQ